MIEKDLGMSQQFGDYLKTRDGIPIMCAHCEHFNRSNRVASVPVYIADNPVIDTPFAYVHSGVCGSRFAVGRVVSSDSHCLAIKRDDPNRASDPSNYGFKPSSEARMRDFSQLAEESFPGNDQD